MNVTFASTSAVVTVSEKPLLLKRESEDEMVPYPESPRLRHFH